MGCLPDLVRCGSGPQRLIDGFEFLLQLFILPLQRSQLGTSIFAFPKRRDRPCHLIRVYLRKQVHAYHHNVAIEGRCDVSAEHNHQSGRVGTDFVFGHIHITDDGDVLQVNRDLFERVSLGGSCGKPDRILASVTVSHSMFALRIHDPNVSPRRILERRQHGEGETENKRVKKIIGDESGDDDHIFSLTPGAKPDQHSAKALPHLAFQKICMLGY